MITREAYMRGDFTHRQYYAQFVTAQIMAVIKQRFSLEQLRSCKDQQHFNDIQLVHWNRLALESNCWTTTYVLLKEAGDWMSLGVQVTILKEATRQYVEQHA